MLERQPTWTHKDVVRYIHDYQSMAIRMNIPLSDIQDFGDAAEILESIELEDFGGYKVAWISGPLEKMIEGEEQLICYVHMDISSLSDLRKISVLKEKPEIKPKTYEVKTTLFNVEGDLYTTDYNHMDHACKSSQFASKYRWRGGVVSPEHHMITTRKTMEKYLGKWCKKRNRPEIKISKIYCDIPDPHKTELLKILNEEGTTLKSIKLRERIYVYMFENDVKLYEPDQNAS
jgi:hypothetical protein